ncbi:MAG: N-acetyltransferase [Cyanobacteria bacterium P01_F01_bin.116]
MNNQNVRIAQTKDAAAIANFNQAIAHETEGRQLSPTVILAGVQALLQNPAYGFYIVTEVETQLVGCLMITTEWSDWRNGLFWWVQSVYVKPDYRRRGIYRQMYSFIKELAEQEPNVCGFRLYVEQDNTRAQTTYKALGMTPTPYRIFEELKSSVKDA